MDTQSEDMTSEKRRLARGTSTRSLRESPSTQRSPSPKGMKKRLPKDKERPVSILVKATPPVSATTPEQQRARTAVVSNASPTAPRRRDRGSRHRHHGPGHSRSNVEDNIRTPFPMTSVVTCCLVAVAGAGLMAYCIYFLMHHPLVPGLTHRRVLHARADNGTAAPTLNGRSSEADDIPSGSLSSTAGNDSVDSDRDSNTVGQGGIALVLGRGN